MTELKSFKNISRLVTVIMALLTMLSMITVEQWQSILPSKYVIFAPIIATGIAFIVNQYSEEKRVRRAEGLIHQQYQTEAQTEEDIISTNDYELSEDPTENLQENNMEVDDDTA